MANPTPPENIRHRGMLIAVTLLGSYCLGANAAIALHELGHALGAWLAGGRVLGIFLAPQGYAGSYMALDLSVAYAIEHGRLLQVAGGVGFGALFAGVFLGACRFWARGSVTWIALHTIGTWCLGNNGAYLFLGGLVPFDDALFLTELGVPQWVLVLLGLPLLFGFFVSLASFLRGIGLEQEAPWSSWAMTVTAGLLAYLALIMLLRVLCPPEDVLPPMPNVALGLACSPLVALLLASCSYPFRAAFRGNDDAVGPPTWRRAGLVLILGLLLIGSEFLFFSQRYH